jgi:endonuclease/exonuclease/phosphatase family metal-dependent hydrolase
VVNPPGAVGFSGTVGGVRVLSWNVAGRADKLPAQLDAVLGRAPDVVALQEISRRTYAAWRHGLSQAGYSIVSAAELAELPYPRPPYRYPQIKQTQIHRKNFNLTASRHPMAALPGLSFEDPEEARLAFPEKFVAAEVSLAGQPVEIHNGHAPPGSTRYLLKPQALAAIARRLEVRPQMPQILSGDFNAPKSEAEAGPVVTWADRYPEVEAEWDAAERRILEHPRLRDAYRQVHQPGDPWPYSHRVKRRGGVHDRRYDHIFVSAHFAVRACRYLTDWLAFSDHAAVEADLALDSK